MKLSAAVSNRAKLEVPFSGEDKLIVYHNPAMFTCEFEMKAREDLEKNTASEFLLNTLSQLLLEWDLVDDEGVILGEDHKGEVVPTDRDTLAKVPFTILIKVSNAISEAHGSSESTDAKNAVSGTPTHSGSFS